MILKLALSDLKWDRLMSVCAVAAMTAVIAPLLLLFSLRYGILSTLEDSLKSNPLNLEIRMLSGYQLDEGVFKELRADPRVGFAVEMTRALSVTANVSAQGRAKSMVETIPTAPGDPLLRLSSIADLTGDHEAVVSQALAEDLGCKAGDELKVAISRTVGGKMQNSVQVFEVKGVLKGALASNYKIYLPLKAVIAMEDWRDGYEPEIFSDGSKPNARRTSFAKVRLYAKDLESVVPLSKKLRAHYSISDKLPEIENVEAIARVLNFIFATVACVSGIGGAAALGGLILSAASRKERAYSMLRITGLSNSGVIAMLVLENLILGGCAFALSCLLCAAGSWVFNAYLGSGLEGGAVVSALRPWHWAAGFLSCELCCALLALLAARFKILSQAPVAALREV